eukprot:6109337-Amphidinium_carterae.1
MKLSPKRRAKPAPLQQRDIGLFDDPIEVEDSQPTCSVSALAASSMQVPDTAVDADTCSNDTELTAPSCTDTVCYEPHGAQVLDSEDDLAPLTQLLCEPAVRGSHAASSSRTRVQAALAPQLALLFTKTAWRRLRHRQRAIADTALDSI